MKNFLHDFIIGVKAWFQSWKFIFKHNLSHYFIYPFLISLLLTMGSVALIKQGVDFLMELITPHIQFTPLNQNDWWEVTKDVLYNLATYAISFVLWLVSFYTMMKISKYLVLALMSPVMALLSEGTDNIITGKNYPFDGPQFLLDALRGSLLAIRNLFMELFIVWSLLAINLFATLFFAPLTLILSPAIAVLIFFVGAYFFGFSTLDYTNERRKLSIRQSISTIRSKMGIAVGLGTLFVLLFYIPVVGVSIATITCTVGSTIALSPGYKLK